MKDPAMKTARHHTLGCLWKFVHLYIVVSIRGIVISDSQRIRVSDRKTVTLRSVTASRVAEEPDAYITLFRRSIRVLTRDQGSVQVEDILDEY